MMTSTSGKVPISSHPGFKWAVAAWFGSLLGLGLFVMPGTIHDLLSTSTGLAALAPFAEPPVAIAGRALLAGIAALVGLLFGLVIAQRVALANALDDDDGDIHFTDEPDASVADSNVRPVWLGDASAEQPAHRVFNPREEIGEEGIAGLSSASQDAEDELVEDATGEEEGEDALMQAWREETGLPEEYPPEEADEETGIAVVEKGSERAAPLRSPLEESADEFLAGTEDRDKIESELAIYEPEPDPAPALSPRGEARGDMSLKALTARLRQALAEAQTRDAEAAAPAILPAELDEPDAVIAFLRREAGRQDPEATSSSEFDGDPQSILRNALDKLSRVSNPK